MQGEIPLAKVLGLSIRVLEGRIKLILTNLGTAVMSSNDDVTGIDGLVFVRTQSKRARNLWNVRFGKFGIRDRVEDYI